MKPSVDLSPSSPFQQSAILNRQQHTNLNESYQAQTQGVSIALTTREGDKITISQQSASSQFRKESTTADSYRLTEQSLRLDSLAISVQGDLNQQELDDLSRLFDDLSSIASHFFNGNLGEALTGAMNIDEMGSISRLEATFTRTSILSNYLEGSHPIPNLNEESRNALAQTPHKKNQINDFEGQTEPRIIDIMAAQWQQFLAAIKPNQANSLPQEHHAPSAAHQDMVAKDMLERARETLSTHPRLTPLIPSVAELALGRTASQYHPRETASFLADSTSTAFNSLFADWIV